MARKSRKKKSAPPPAPVASPAGELSRGGDACGAVPVPAPSAADPADAVPAGSADLANAGSARPSSVGLSDAANARSARPSSETVTIGGDTRYRERDRKLLLFLWLYGLAIYPVLSRLFFGGPKASCGHVARRLVDAGLIEIVERGFPGGITWLSLTAAGAKKVQRRAKPKLTGARLEDSLQTLLFCTLSESGLRRYRLLHGEVEEAVGNVLPSNVHVVLTEEIGEQPVLLRCFHVTGGKSNIKAVRSLIEDAEAKPALRTLLYAKDVGFAILCPTPEARDALRRDIEAAQLSDYRIVVEWAPRADQLAAYLKHIRKKEE